MSVRSVVFKGNPCWLVDVRRRETGARRRRYLAKSRYLKRDALAIERELIDELGHRANNRSFTSKSSTVTAAQVVSASSDTNTPTFEQFAREFLALADRNRSDYRNKERELRLHLVPLLGPLRLDEINARVVDQVRARLRTAGGPSATSRRTRDRKGQPVSRRRKGGARSPKTINNILGTLRTLLNRAHEYGLIQFVPKIRFEKEAETDPEFLDFEETTALVDALDDEWRVLVLFAIRTGLRRGELMELRWSDLSLEGARPYVRVRRALKRDERGAWVVKSTKGNRPRRIPLSRDLVPVLREHRGARRGAKLVFPASDGGYLNPDGLYRALVAASHRTGLQKHVHPHMLRHTFGSHCTMRGVMAEKIRQWMGHASLKTTERYAHLRPDYGDELIDRLAAEVTDRTDKARRDV